MHTYSSAKLANITCQSSARTQTGEPSLVYRAVDEPFNKVVWVRSHLLQALKAFYTLTNRQAVEHDDTNIQLLPHR